MSSNSRDQLPHSGQPPGSLESIAEIVTAAVREGLSSLNRSRISLPETLDLSPSNLDTTGELANPLLQDRPCSGKLTVCLHSFSSY